MILVTGGSGMQGQPVCRRLVEMGKEVINIDLQDGDTWSQRQVRADIADWPAMEAVFKQYPVEVVIHLASMLHTESWKNPDRAFETNVLASVHLLNLARQYGVRRFVFGSTVDAIGYLPPETGPVDESYDILPSDFYGETKRFIEKMGVAYAEQYGMDFVSARIPFLVGPGQPSATSAWRMDLFNLLPTGGVLQFGFPPEAVIPVVDCRDSAESIIVLALAEQVQHRIYHTPGESWRLSDLAAEVGRIGEGVEVRYGNKDTDFYPQAVSCERFFREFGGEPVSLVRRLEQYKAGHPLDT